MATNYIEEMYKLVGLYPKEEKYCYWQCGKPELRNVACTDTNCPHYVHKVIPHSFTPEKQLQLCRELSLWVGKHSIEYGIHAESDGSWDDYNEEYEARIKANKIIYMHDMEFDEALAKMVYELIQEHVIEIDVIKEILQN